MNTKPHTLTSLIKYLACLALLLAITANAQDKTTDPNGTWTWSVPGRNGGPDRVFTLVLKAEADKLTGTLTLPGRGDNPGAKVDITDGKINGGEISFNLSRPGRDGGSPVVNTYTGKIVGDKIEGKVQSPAHDGGAQTSRDWKAERKSDK